jgi:hypothetical protein
MILRAYKAHENRKAEGTPMVKSPVLILCVTGSLVFGSGSYAQTDNTETSSHTLYDIAPRQLVDLPTAGTLPRGNFQMGLRLYADGGALGNTDIGLSSRFQMGISFGGTGIVGSHEPQWNPHIGFNLKFRIIDELEYFPAIAIGYTDQGYGPFRADYSRYTFKSRGFYAVASRNFYFYKWTSGWHAGINYSREDDGDGDNDFNVFGGFDATFNYNMASWSSTTLRSTTTGASTLTLPARGAAISTLRSNGCSPRTWSWKCSSRTSPSTGGNPPP